MAYASIITVCFERKLSQMAEEIVRLTASFFF